MTTINQLVRKPRLRRQAKSNLEGWVNQTRFQRNFRKKPALLPGRQLPRCCKMRNWKQTQKVMALQRRQCLQSRHRRIPARKPVDRDWVAAAVVDS